MEPPPSNSADLRGTNLTCDLRRQVVGGSEEGIATNPPQLPPGTASRRGAFEAAMPIWGFFQARY